MRSVRTALAIVEIVARRQPVALTDLAAELDLPVTTVHRSLATLSEAGWLRQVPPGRQWVLSSRVDHLFGRSLALLADRARPVLEDLRAATGESSMYAVVDGDHMVVVASIDSAQALRVVGREGSRHHLHVLSTGKAVLATWPAPAVDAYADRLGLDRAALAAACAETRAAGFAVNVGGWEAGVASVSVAVPTVDGPATAAVGLFGPVDRLGGPVAPLADLVRAAAGHLVDPDPDPDSDPDSDSAERTPR